MPTMNAEVKKKWVDALKSGEYQQTTGTLKDNNSYCCLGVLCDLYIKEHTGVSWDTLLPLYPDSERHAKLATWGELPDIVVDWAGVDVPNPMIGNDCATGW